MNCQCPKSPGMSRLAMSRRAVLGLIGGGALILSGCFEEKTGPAEIHWDRDVCKLCSMIISDARFTAQVRGGPKQKVYKFDDIGCAVNWLNGQPWAGDNNTEIWVAERTSTRQSVRWLKARDARYVTNDQTPMNYGFGATLQNLPGSIDFVALTNRILAKAPNHICPAPSKKPKQGVPG